MILARFFKLAPPAVDGAEHGDFTGPDQLIDRKPHAAVCFQCRRGDTMRSLAIIQRRCVTTESRSVCNGVEATPKTIIASSAIISRLSPASSANPGAFT